MVVHWRDFRLQLPRLTPTKKQMKKSLKLNGTLSSQEGGLASKVVEPYLKKGNSVYIEGRLRTRSWEDKEGITRYTTEVLCDSLEMLGKKSDNSESSSGGESSTSSLQDSPDDDLPF